MYLEHYQLKSKPFQITPDPNFLWLGEKHREALATLRYGIIDNRGFLLLTGEVGTGKTILINRLVSLLNIDTVVATLTDPDLETMDFYNLLADGLGMHKRFDSKGAFLIHFRDFLYQSHRKHKQVLLIIDECQRLNPRLIEDIRVLSNIELHDRKLINIFFVGQQEFNKILMTPQNRALAQRITVRYHIEPLDENETKSFIQHRLKVAGSDKQIFDASALKAIYSFSGGLPRLINIISDHALLTGYAQNVLRIDGKLVFECIEDLRIPIKGTKGRSNPKHTEAINAVDLNNGSHSQGNSSTTTNKQIHGKIAEISGTADTIANDKSISWRFAYAAMVLLLIGIVGFAITHFGKYDQLTWGTDDLTPQKYKTTLEKKKEALSSQMSIGETAEGGLKSEARLLGELQEKVADQQDDLGETQNDSIARPVLIQSNPGSNSDRIDASEEKDKEIESIEPLPLLNKNMIVNFDSNSNEIEEQSFVILNEIAHYLVDHSNESIYVRGYTDSSGQEIYNEKVSLFRANNVKAYLIGRGVASDQILVLAMGAKDPIASNEDIEGRRKNRRVEIEFTK